MSYSTNKAYYMYIQIKVIINNGLQDKNYTATWDVMEQLCVIFTANAHKYLRLSPNKEDIYSRQQAVLPSLLIIYVIG